MDLWDSEVPVWQKSPEMEVTEIIWRNFETLSAVESQSCVSFLDTDF